MIRIPYLADGICRLRKKLLQVDYVVQGLKKASDQSVYGMRARLGKHTLIGDLLDEEEEEGEEGFGGKGAVDLESSTGTGFDFGVLLARISFTLFFNLPSCILFCLSSFTSFNPCLQSTLSASVPDQAYIARTLLLSAAVFQHISVRTFRVQQLDFVHSMLVYCSVLHNVGLLQKLGALNVEISLEEAQERDMYKLAVEVSK